MEIQPWLCYHSDSVTLSGQESSVDRPPHRCVIRDDKLQFGVHVSTSFACGTFVPPATKLSDFQQRLFSKYRRLNCERCWEVREQLYATEPPRPAAAALCPWLAGEWRPFWLLNMCLVANWDQVTNSWVGRVLHEREICFFRKTQTQPSNEL